MNELSKWAAEKMGEPVWKNINDEDVTAVDITQPAEQMAFWSASGSKKPAMLSAMQTGGG